MKVAYIFATDMAATFKLATMILPQLEADKHGAGVAGMFFFDDNVYSLRKGDPTGERLAKVAVAKKILLMACDQCALRRNLAEGEFWEQTNEATIGWLRKPSVKRIRDLPICCTFALATLRPLPPPLAQATPR